MPSTYAHYRFGAAMLPVMPADIRRTVKRFRQLYDVGLHGPDIFFYYNPVISTKIGSLGHKFHMQSGEDFFQRVCRLLRLDPSEAANAYLYGVLTHYCLDAVMHPFISEKAAQGIAAHKQIESEFDRYLLQIDGKTPPCTQDLSPHIRLTPGECETTARFYPGATAKHIRDGVRNMAFITKLLATPEGTKRTLLEKTLSVKSADRLLIPAAPDPACSHLDEVLLGLYRDAEALFPTLLMQLNAHLTYNAPLGESFAPVFG